MSGARPSARPASRQRRATILDAARGLIADRGVDKLVIADVAERADVSVATIYNLVGTRDRLLIALLDDVAEAVRARLAEATASAGIDGCVEVILAACETIIADAATMRPVLASVGAVAPDQWLSEGLEGTINERVEAAVDVGDLTNVVPPSSVSAGIQLGLRGALISWVLGLLPDAELAASAEQMTLYVLASAAAPAPHRRIQMRLQELSLQQLSLQELTTTKDNS